jgi:hypothetical protein
MSTHKPESEPASSSNLARIKWICCRLLPIVLVFAFIGVSAWLLCGPHHPEPVGRGKPLTSEPLYKGKPLTSWLELYSLGPDRNFAEHFKQANEAVRSLGTNAIPTLLRMLRTTGQDPVIAFERNHRGAMGLQALGQAAGSAVPAVIQIYEARLSPSSERWSSYALGAIGPAAKEAIPALLRGATNANPQSRQNSLIALASMHTEPALVVAALTNAFRDEDGNVRLWACNRFGLLGNEALEARSAALAALEPLLQDPDPRVQREAAAVHKKIDSHVGGTRN